MKSYQIEVQHVEDVSGEQHYKFKGGEDVLVTNVKSEAEAIAACSLWLRKNRGFESVLLPHTAKPVEDITVVDDIIALNDVVNAQEVWRENPSSLLGYGIANEVTQ